MEFQACARIALYENDKHKRVDSAAGLSPPLLVFITVMWATIVSFITLAAATSVSASTTDVFAGPSATGLPSSDSSLYTDFSLTCSSWGGLYGSDYAILEATCDNENGGTNTTSINLNDCIANAGTSLVCTKK